MRDISKPRGTVVVVGLGYIGLPTASILADRGVGVVGVDVNVERVEAINRGVVPFVEPDLGRFLESAVKEGRLTAQGEVPEADVYIVAVPTPLKADLSADLSFVEAAIDSISQRLVGGELVVLESTSPPGTTARLADRVRVARPDLVSDDLKLTVDFAHCPERVLPGKIMTELVVNDRIVGGLSPRAAGRARDLYRVFCEGEIHLTDATTAEMAKLTENAFRDVNIAFANELSLIAEKVGVDVFELINLANKHPRVNILQPGPGVGGHCIAVDPWFIAAAAPRESMLIRTSRAVNDAKPSWVVSRVKEALGVREKPSLAVLGLAFKPDVDDMRQSPALEIAVRLSEEYPDGRILVVEPYIDVLPASLARKSNVQLVGLSEALRSADVVALLVDHSPFKEMDHQERPSVPVIDTRGVWRD